MKEEKSPKKKRELTKRPLSSASEAEDFEDIKPQKKARPEPKKPKASANSGSSAMTEDPTEGAIPLGKNRFVAVRCFKGKQYLDIREYFMNANGQMQPGKKGVTLKRPQWEHLKDSFFDIDDKLVRITKQILYIIILKIFDNNFQAWISWIRRSGTN